MFPIAGVEQRARELSKYSLNGMERQTFSNYKLFDSQQMLVTPMTDFAAIRQQIRRFFFIV